MVALDRNAFEEGLAEVDPDSIVSYHPGIAALVQERTHCVLLGL